MWNHKKKLNNTNLNSIRNHKTKTTTNKNIMFSGSDLYLNAPYIFFMIYASFIGTPKSKSNLS